MSKEIKEQDNDKEKSESTEKKTKSAGIPLRLVPNEADEIAEEMQKVFDEDKVVHRHGSSEPESD